MARRELLSGLSPQGWQQSGDSALPATLTALATLGRRGEASLWTVYIS